MTERFGLDVPPQDRRPVAWYAPVGLRNIAQQQLWSMNLLRNLDRRETFRGQLELVDLRGLADADTGEFWFDFLADTGDGGSATYAVARGVLAGSLAAEGTDAPLPEGRLLILGGDLAYPGASPELYQSRLVEMFELARDAHSRFREVPRNVPHKAPYQAHEKLVAAIPQNHDWFDSASTFCRYFVNDEKAGLVGARSPQSRTYFAFALPHDWFVLGFDFALTGDIDRSQYEAFCTLVESKQIPPGAHLILVYPEPYWTRPLGDQIRAAYPLRFQRLEALMARHGLHVRMRLAGDIHHYARERLDIAPPGRHSTDLVTCGCGGAFGHATHAREVMEPKALQWASETEAAQAELQGRLVIGRVPDIASAEAAGVCFRPTQAEREGRGQARCYPDPDTSRAQAWGNAVALLRPRGARWWTSNLAFSVLIGALLLVGAAGALAGVGSSLGGWLAALLSSPWALGAHAALAVTAVFLTTDNDPARAPWSDRWIGALLFGLLAMLCWAFATHVVTPALVAWGPAESPPDLVSGLKEGLTTRDLRGYLRRLGLGLAGWGLATVAAGLAVGSFLALLSRLWGRAITNTSSALSLQGHKGFLRFRLGPEGIDAHMLGCDEVPARWAPADGADPTVRPYWQPAAGEPPLRWRVVDRFTMQR